MTTFLRYLTLFMNLLNDCSEEEQDKALDPNRKRSMSNLSALRNCTVQAMSNLLNANIDSGLMHSIGELGCVFGLLVGWLDRCLAGCLASYLFGWLLGWVVIGLGVCQVGWLFG